MRTLHFQQTLGTGSFGTVYLAELSSAPGHRETVAVKVLVNTGPEGDLFVSRIRDEARLLRLLQDESILKVMDMVSLEGRDAVVMEFVDGCDLDSLVPDAGLPPRVVAEIGSGVAGALSRAHAARHPATGAALNVIHRDIKPANVMVTGTGGVKLLDFGIARARFDARESQTGQLVLGTLNYMAPEYVVTGEVSPAADVYGLALTLYELATGTVYGQPKVRQDGHERRVDQRLENLPTGCAPLAPLLRAMLDWVPERRPGAAAAEARLRSAADRMPGPGLQPWARRAVVEQLARRSPAPDAAGLVGRSFPLGPAAAQPPAASGGQAEIRVAPPISSSRTRSPSRGTGSPPQFLASPSRTAPPSRPARGTQTRDESRETGHNGGAAAPLRPVPAVGPHPRLASQDPSPAATPTRLPPPSSPPPAAPAPLGPLSGPPPSIAKTILAGLAVGTLVGLVVVGTVIAVLVNA